jgi:hypothetical protein
MQKLNITEKAMLQIARACKSINWSIAFNQRAKAVRYLIIGENKEVDKILTKLKIKPQTKLNKRRKIK